MAKSDTAAKATEAEQNYFASLEGAPSGFNVYATWSAIFGWLYVEHKLQHDAVFEQGLALAYTATKNAYEIESSLALSELSHIGTAGMLFGSAAFKNQTNFRSFLKTLGVIGMGSEWEAQEIGEVAMLLLAFLEVVKEYEPSKFIERYETDINAICIQQLDCENIFEEIQETARTLFSEFKSPLQEHHPAED